MIGKLSLRSPLKWIGTAALAASLFGLSNGVSAQNVFNVSIDAMQEVPPSGTGGTGQATVTLDASTGAINVSGTFTGLSSGVSAAHIHGPAPPGVNGGIFFFLVATGTTSGTISGNGNISPANVTNMLCGLTYINIHSAMFGGGEIRGQITATALSTVYGTGVNPPGSISIVSGGPSINTTVTVGVDNPLGTQAVGSFAFLALADAQDPTFIATGAGTLLPNFGQSAPGAPGELLVSLTGPNPIPPLLVGGPWLGAGSPVNFALAVPNDKTLIGRTFYVQGLMFDPPAAGGIKFGLSDAIDFYFGP